MRSEAATSVYLPDVIVVRLAMQMVSHPEASGHLQASDGEALVDVKLEAGRITVLTLEGPEKGTPPQEFSVLELRAAQVYVMGKAYRTWLVGQAEQYGLKEPLWE